MSTEGETSQTQLFRFATEKKEWKQTRYFSLTEPNQTGNAFKVIFYSQAEGSFEKGFKKTLSANYSNLADSIGGNKDSVIQFKWRNIDQLTKQKVVLTSQGKR